MIQIRRELDPIARPLVPQKLIHQQVDQQAADGAHDQQQTDRIHELLLRQKLRCLGRQQVAQPRMARHVVLAQRQHGRLGQGVDANAGDHQDCQQQGIQPAQQR